MTTNAARTWRTAAGAARRPSGLGWDHQRLTAVTVARQPWCSWCGQTQTEVEARGDKLTGDHLVRRADGGANTLDNYVTACGRCNSGRG